MLKNYFKIAWRNLIKNKVYSAINIGGLAVGMAVAMLIGLWIYNEFSFNKHHKNNDRIAQVMQNGTFNGQRRTQTSNPALMSSVLRAKFGSDFKYVVQSSGIGGNFVLSVGDRHFSNTGIYFESDAPEMLTLKMLKGTRQGLKDPYSVLLSATTAEAIFGKTDPVGKIIKFNANADVVIKGVYEDLPENSSFGSVKVMLSWQLWLIRNSWALQNPWSTNNSQTFVQIADHADMEKVSAKIRNIKTDNAGPGEEIYKWEVFLQPMSKWHLYKDFKDGVNIGGSIRYVWLFGIIGIFVLVLACINFMNLSTARSSKRAKEVGIRKAIGSMKWQIMRQFFSESYVVVLLAFVISLMLVIFLLPFFNDVADKKITVPWSNTLFWLSSIIFIFITGLLAGSYPALYLSSFKPLKVLKGTFKVGKDAVIPRRVLTVLQFTVSVMLIIGTIIIYQQIQHAKDRPIGYSSSNLISTGLKPEIRQHFDALRTELINTGAIEEMTASNSSVTTVYNTNGGFEWEGKDPNFAVSLPHNFVTVEYGKTIKWTIKKGRDFSRQFATDSLAFIINESASEFFGFKDPVGKTLKWDDRSYTIIGVISDILQESPFSPVRPTLYRLDNYDGMSNLIMRLDSAENVSAALGVIEHVFKKYTHNAPFDYRFVDQNFESKFRAEQRIGKLSSYFAVLAIFISCLGMFGMASFVAEQRTREIGIRKVLGATVGNLWRLLSTEFVLLVLLSCMLAAPIAYYYLSDWLNNYDYRINISWKVFVSASAVALVITLIIVSVQTIKAALMNPVNSLRSE